MRTLPSNSIVNVNLKEINEHKKNQIILTIMLDVDARTAQAFINISYVSSHSDSHLVETTIHAGKLQLNDIGL